MDTLVLADDRTSVTLVPALGGGIARMDAKRADGGTAAVLRPWSNDGSGDPFRLGCNVLVPFSNRISGGGFAFGAFHPVPANLPGEALPIHGDGFQKAWKVVESSVRAATLALETGEIGPYRYRVTLDYAVSNGDLTATLAVTNTGPLTLPFGAGFHPWFPRTSETTLTFAASHVWLEDERHLPTERIPVTERPEWDFTNGRGLPPDWINNAFAGWPGAASIDRPEDRIRIDIAASPNLDAAIVFSPGAEADFFCFEPVSHAVDAHNQPGQPGLVPLDPAQSMEVRMDLRWTPIS